MKLHIESTIAHHLSFTFLYSVRSAKNWHPSYFPGRLFNKECASVEELDLQARTQLQWLSDSDMFPFFRVSQKEKKLLPNVFLKREKKKEKKCI